MHLGLTQVAPSEIYARYVPLKAVGVSLAMLLASPLTELHISHSSFPLSLLFTLYNPSLLALLQCYSSSPFEIH